MDISILKEALKDTGKSMLWAFVGCLPFGWIIYTCLPNVPWEFIYEWLIVEAKLMAMLWGMILWHNYRWVKKWRKFDE